MLKHLVIFAVLVGFLAFAVGASPVRDSDEIYEEINTPEGMVLIPAGEFQMGSDDEDADDDERPVHTVYVDAFYMDEYEVTNAQFKAFVDANPHWQKDQIDAKFHDSTYLYDWSGTDYPSGKADHPVVWVSWYAAMAYAEWAGKRLPTEAEWEYAARGGLAGQKYPWGNTLVNDRSWGGNTTPVGAYAANGYGLYDMAGNVWEWCLDAYDAEFYAESQNSRNPISEARTLQWLLDNFTSIPTNSWRVSRGGSFFDVWRGGPNSGTFFPGTQFVRVAERGRATPSGTIDSYGFRCVRDITP